MREVGVLETKTHLSSLLDGIEAGGEPVVITRHGKPVAKLVAIEPTSVPQRYAFQDFAPLPERRLTGEELAASFRELREQIARESPSSLSLTWEELKRMARE